MMRAVRRFATPAGTGLSLAPIQDGRPTLYIGLALAILFLPDISTGALRAGDVMGIGGGQFESPGAYPSRLNIVSPNVEIPAWTRASVFLKCAISPGFGSVQGQA